MSTNNLDQLAAAQKANAEVMTALMRTAFEGMEKLAALNMAASREFFNTSISSAQQMLAARRGSWARSIAPSPSRTCRS